MPEYECRCIHCGKFHYVKKPSGARGMRCECGGALHNTGYVVDDERGEGAALVPPRPKRKLDHDEQDRTIT